MAPSVLGVDGWPGGWIGALVDGAGIRWVLLPDAASLRPAAPAAVIGIDVPIGLPARGDRACDLAARAALGPARNSVFLTPARAVLAAGDYPTANRISREVNGKGLSKQTWHILDRVANVDGALGDPPDPGIVEVHPEVSFRAMDARITASKKTATGIGQRVRAVGAAFGAVAIDALGEIPPGPAIDDALDALAAAWSARRWRDGVASTHPVGPPSYDERGRPMRIVT